MSSALRGPARAAVAGLSQIWHHASVRYVRVFNRSTVQAFVAAHADARQPLFAWFAEVEKATWTGPDDIKLRYPSASLIPGNRVVFNIKGNHYRVVAAIKFEFFAVYIRFIGTHSDYDGIDAATV